MRTATSPVKVASLLCVAISILRARMRLVAVAAVIGSLEMIRFSLVITVAAVSLAVMPSVERTSICS